MKENLIDLLECPLCHNKLSWKIERINAQDIISGLARCTKCLCEYPIYDSIALFLEPKLQNMKIWKRKEEYIKRHYDKNLEKMQKLLNTPINELSASDLLIRANLMRNCGKYDEVTKLIQFSISKSMLNDCFETIDILIKKCINSIKDYDGVILDIASGKGYLAFKLLNEFSGQLVMSDINPAVLKQNFDMMNELDMNKDVSFVAFDVKKSPFKDHSFSMMTTLLGLQNIFYSQNVLKELKRICCGKFYSISSFCKEEDTVNVQELVRRGLESMWLRLNYEKLFELSGWKLECLSSQFVNAPVVETDNILKSVSAITKFPLKSTIFEYCLTVAI
ncbi:MAG: class I SAM-dependent methyltransferase [Halanaerobiales bacterium]|nr:class I SAM-dependent methyltransferase [Halanaerobiales bacterium]